LLVQAVLDFDVFESLVVLPTPPKVKDMKNDKEFFDTNDRKYTAAVQDYASKKTAYMLIQSLAATPDLEWDTVDLDKPGTWHRAEGELSKIFTEFGMNKITQAVLKVNGLGEDILEQARQSFLASRSRRND
jgi:hypothetical protein